MGSSQLVIGRLNTMRPQYWAWHWQRIDFYQLHNHFRWKNGEAGTVTFPRCERCQDSLFWDHLIRKEVEGQNSNVNRRPPPPRNLNVEVSDAGNIDEGRQNRDVGKNGVGTQIW